MDENTIQDLKQFIYATVHQEISGLEERLENKIDTKLDILDKKIDDRSDEILSAIGDTTSDRFEAIEEDVKNLDTRVTKLESNPT
jgi:polyhydroxyalkanoate synthesis regulator phasin